ncbi:hypothetical protein QR685DRAFT_437670, partial [Neurospora intermedia]
LETKPTGCLRRLKMGLKDLDDSFTVHQPARESCFVVSAIRLAANLEKNTSLQRQPAVHSATKDFWGCIDVWFLCVA